MIRYPLAFRPTAEVRVALDHRARLAGIAVDDPATFGAYAGDLIAQVLPEVVTELVNLDGEP